MGSFFTSRYHNYEFTSKLLHIITYRPFKHFTNLIFHLVSFSILIWSHQVTLRKTVLLQITAVMWAVKCGLSTITYFCNPIMSSQLHVVCFYQTLHTSYWSSSVINTLPPADGSAVFQNLHKRSQHVSLSVVHSEQWQNCSSKRI